MKKAHLDTIVLLEVEQKFKYPAQEVPSEEPTGEQYVVLGRIIKCLPEQPAKLYKTSIFRHVLIAGTTGSGKSYTASVIASRASAALKLPVVIIDWHGEYDQLLENFELVDPRETPLALFTGDPSDTSIISSVFELTPPQEYLLEKVIKKIDIRKLRSIDSLLEYVEAYPEESSWIRETKLSLHRKLCVLTRQGLEELFVPYKSSSEGPTIINPANASPYIINASLIPDLSVRRLYSSLAVKRLVDYSSTARFPLLITLEESQNYLSREHPVRPICDMIREVRKLGIGFVIISQSIYKLADDVVMNTNTKIVHAIKSRADLEVVEKTLYLEDALLSIVPYLEPGEAVYSTPTLKKAVLVKIE